jgi:UDP-3-O-[3-hydroxymyristoyl] glucosamine N-acyltransferase
MKESPEIPAPPLTLEELAGLLGCSFAGDGRILLTGVANLKDAREGDLVFFSQEKLRDQFESTRAAAAIVLPEEKFTRLPLIFSSEPHPTFVRAVNLFFKPYRPRPGIHPLAQVSSTARIGKDVSVGAFALVGSKVEIGNGTVIFPHATVYPGVKIGNHCLIHSQVSLREGVSLGDRVILHNGVVIGSDGYGYLQTESKSHTKIPQAGGVTIEDDVEIGANTTVDRAALGHTIIRRGTKIDNLVQIAHNVEIGENSLIISQVGIGGSSRIGKNVILAGQAGIPDHIHIGDNAIVLAKTGITKDIPEGALVSGSPHLDARVWRKAWAVIPQLYDLIKEVKRLKKQIEKMKSDR